MSLKKCSKRIFEKNSRFRDFGQKWPILAIFGQKIRFLDIFFESAQQLCPELGQKLGTFALNQLMVGFCLEKFFGPPRSGWDLWFSFRSCVRPCVRPAGRDLKNRS